MVFVEIKNLYVWFRILKGQILDIGINRRNTRSLFGLNKNELPKLSTRRKPDFTKGGFESIPEEEG